MKQKTMATKARTQPASAGARTALWWGIAFSALFTGLIWLLDPLLADIVLLPDEGASWYYWKLPDPTLWSRASAWVLYAGHQVSFWGLIYYAQTRRLRYQAGLHRVNVVALGVNSLFLLLHLVQTHLWYDGLAQDVSIFSSQGSVILLLVAVLLMENRRRGLFFGKKVRWNFFEEAAGVMRRYHGYLFAWAVVYTFWFHPMVATTGHLIGFFYMFLLMLQGSLFFTRVHLNRYWTFVQEFLVLVHGTLVAVQQGNGLWPMFFFGFAAIFIVTQMYGLGLKAWQRWTFVLAYVAGVLLVYSQRGWVQANEIIRIPVIEYAAVFVMALLIWLVTWTGGTLLAWTRGEGRGDVSAPVAPNR